jgi:signal peptidase I
VREIWKPALKFVAWFAAIVFVIGLILRLTKVEIMVVGHNGMAPTVEAGEMVLIWRGTDFLLGDIAVCQKPDSSDLVMGRVVGTPGSHVRTQRGQLEVNGTVPDVDWQGELTFRDTLNDRTDTVRVGLEELSNHTHGIFLRGSQEFSLRDYDVEEGRLFLLGDNRHHPADDSRNFGTVEVATCMGTVFMRVKPADEQVNDLGHGYFDILR